jgi:hypothetical protein
MISPLSPPDATSVTMVAPTPASSCAHVTRTAAPMKRAMKISARPTRGIKKRMWRVPRSVAV